MNILKKITEIFEKCENFENVGENFKKQSEKFEKVKILKKDSKHFEKSKKNKVKWCIYIVTCSKALCNDQFTPSGPEAIVNVFKYSKNFETGRENFEKYSEHFENESKHFKKGSDNFKKR